MRRAALQQLRDSSDISQWKQIGTGQPDTTPGIVQTLVHKRLGCEED